MESNYAGGIAEWLAESMANLWQRATVTHFGVGENRVKRVGSFGALGFL
jgi:hypothetical protein